MADSTVYLMTRKQLLDLVGAAASEAVSWHQERGFIVEHTRRHTLEKLDRNEDELDCLLKGTVADMLIEPLVSEIWIVLRAWMVDSEPEPVPLRTAHHAESAVASSFERWTPVP